MSCSAFYNEYDGVEHDYTRKQGLVWGHIFLPDFAPVEWQERAKLWNAVEEAEKTKDSRLAREFVAALPIELGKDEWIDLLSKFIQEQFVDDGMCADVAIHDTDGHNPHAHIMLTVRPLNDNGTWQHKTEKEYLCVKDGEERGFTAAEYKEAQKDGWEKQYQYKVGKKKEYMTPSAAEAQGLERVSKYPKSTKYGRQNRISERWNSEEQLVKWRAAWADEVNLCLEQKGIDERIDHRSFAAQGKDEQPTIHEGAAARMLENKGFVSERCELNRQIRRDNALLRELKDEIQKLFMVVQNTIPALAKAFEKLRARMIVMSYQIIHSRRFAKRSQSDLSEIRPLLRKYDRIVSEMKERITDRQTLLTKREALTPFQFSARKRIDQDLTKLTEELEELQYYKNDIQMQFGKHNAKEMKEVRTWINNRETELRKAEDSHAKYIALLDSALSDYRKLERQAKDADPQMLADARLTIRAEEEQKVISDLEQGYGHAYDPDVMRAAKDNISKLLEDKEIAVQHQLTSPSQRQWKNHEQRQKEKSEGHSR